MKRCNKLHKRHRFSGIPSSRCAGKYLIGTHCVAPNVFLSTLMIFAHVALFPLSDYKCCLDFETSYQDAFITVVLVFRYSENEQFWMACNLLTLLSLPPCLAFLLFPGHLLPHILFPGSLGVFLIVYCLYVLFLVHFLICCLTNFLK